MKLGVWFVLVCALHITRGAKILMVPANTNSHILKFSHLAEGLSRQGDVVQIILPSNNKMATFMSLNENFTVQHYPVDDNVVPYANSREVSEGVIEICLVGIRLGKNQYVGSTGQATQRWEREGVCGAHGEQRLHWNAGKVWIRFRCDGSLDCHRLLHVTSKDIEYSVCRLYLSNFLDALHRKNSTFTILHAVHKLGRFGWYDIPAKIVSLSFSRFWLRWSTVRRYQTETMFAQLYLDPNMETSYTEIMSNASLWFIEGESVAELPISSYAEFHQHCQHWRHDTRPLKPLSEDLEFFPAEFSRTSDTCFVRELLRLRAGIPGSRVLRCFQKVEIPSDMEIEERNALCEREERQNHGLDSSKRPPRSRESPPVHNSWWIQQHGWNCLPRKTCNNISLDCRSAKPCGYCGQTGVWH